MSPNASFDDNAITTGLSCPRRKDLIAIVTGVSFMPFATFPNVLDVQGATNNKSKKFLGPIDSDSSMLF